MKNRQKNLCAESRVTSHGCRKGFSLVEVLMASGILAVGLLMVAGTFPVGIFLTAAAVEQTIAPIVADEAFAKIQLYGINFGGTTYSLPAFGASVKCDDFNNINLVKALGPSYQINGQEYLYPSDSSIPVYSRVYSWSAICRRLVDSNDTLVQVTVFVSRKTGSGLSYYRQDNTGVISSGGSQPTPIRISTNFGTSTNQLQVTQSYITDGCTLVADASGNIYRVLDHTNSGGRLEATLDKDWVDNNSDVWLVPPPTTGGRSPVIGVYQRIIKF